MNFNYFGIEVNVYYNYASSLTGWCQGVRNKFKIARGPWILQLYSSLPIDIICQNIKHIAIPVGHLCFSGDIITNFRGFCIFFRNCSYLHTVSSTLFLHYFSSISCIRSIVSYMHTVQLGVNSFYRTSILSGVSFNLRSFSHLYYRVNPFVPLITSKFISTLQVVQRVVYDNL